VERLEADEARCSESLGRSPVIAAALNPVLGFERAGVLAREAARRGVSVRDLAVERGWLGPEEADRLLDLRRMTGP
jgi:fumarate hydratase class II